jgi:hypothetical protein
MLSKEIIAEKKTQSEKLSDRYCGVYAPLAPLAPLGMVFGLGAFQTTTALVATLEKMIAFGFWYSVSGQNDGCVTTQHPPI